MAWLSLDLEEADRSNIGVKIHGGKTEWRNGCKSVEIRIFRFHERKNIALKKRSWKFIIARNNKVWLMERDWIEILMGTGIASRIKCFHLNRGSVSYALSVKRSSNLR